MVPIVSIIWFLGMKHDFSAQHEAMGCNGQGIMSYGNPPNKWSPCSKADFQAHYITVKSRWCMDCEYISYVISLGLEGITRSQID